MTDTDETCELYREYARLLDAPRLTVVDQERMAELEQALGFDEAQMLAVGYVVGITSVEVTV